MILKNHKHLKCKELLNKKWKWSQKIDKISEINQNIKYLSNNKRLSKLFQNQTTKYSYQKYR